jgi:hypothetical protein
VDEEPLLDPVALTIEDADPAGFAIGLPTALPPVLADGFRRAAQLLGNPPPAPDPSPHRHLQHLQLAKPAIASGLAGMGVEAALGKLEHKQGSAGAYSNALQR